MKYRYEYELDEGFEDSEYFSAKDRRKPKGRRTVKNLNLKDDKKLSSADKFDDPNLQDLYERGILEEVMKEIKSGKEATVYLAKGPKGLMAAKIYRDAATRSFSNDQIYKSGRGINPKHRKKLLNAASKNEISAEQSIWIYHEYKTIWEFFKAGISVPKPFVGPGIGDIVKAGRVVLMEYFGNANEAAPRLSDVTLSKDEAEDAWRQSLAMLKQVLELGKVHGDFSTYNILWWQNRAILIDFPQVVAIAENKHAKQILKNDLQSLTKSFSIHGIEKDPNKLFKELLDEIGIMF